MYRALKALLIDHDLVARVDIGDSARAQQVDRRELIPRGVGVRHGDCRLHRLRLFLDLGAADLFLGRVAYLGAHGGRMHDLLHRGAQLVHVHTGGARLGRAVCDRALADDGRAAALQEHRRGIDRQLAAVAAFAARGHRVLVHEAGLALCRARARALGGIGLCAFAALVGEGKLLIIVQRYFGQDALALYALYLRAALFRLCRALMRAAQLKRENGVLVLGGGRSLLFVHRGVILHRGTLARLAERLDEASVEALDREEYQQHQQHGHRPVKAERIFKPDGYKPAYNAAAL